MAIVLATVVATLGVSYWLITSYLFPDSFTPVSLSTQEQQRLDRKLIRLGVKEQPASERSVEAEPYSEKGARREIDLTEREINALLANNTDLARRLAIDLSDDLASAKLLVPLDPEMPIFGGKTLKVTAGLEMRMARGRPRVVLKGVSVWGVPVPSAWLGELKNVDLVAEFGEAGGFWQAFNEGVEEIQVTEGKLRIRLKE